MNFLKNGETLVSCAIKTKNSNYDTMLFYHLELSLLIEGVLLDLMLTSIFKSVSLLCIHCLWDYSIAWDSFEIPLAKVTSDLRISQPNG